MTTPNIFNDCSLSAKIPFRLSSLPNIKLTKLDTGKLVQNLPTPFSVAPNLNLSIDLSDLEVGNYFKILLIDTTNRDSSSGRPVFFRYFYSTPTVPGPVTVSTSIMDQHSVLQPNNRLSTTRTMVVDVPTDGTPVVFTASSTVTGLQAEIYIVDKTTTNMNVRIIMSQALPVSVP